MTDFEKQFLKDSYDVEDVIKGTEYWKKFLLSRAIDIFIVEGLPATLSYFQIRMTEIVKGHVAAFKGKLKAGGGEGIYSSTLMGGSAFYAPAIKGGNPYYILNKITYTNPSLAFNTSNGNTYTDGKDCVIMFNSEIDKVGGSFMWDLICRYARMLADLESTWASSLVGARISKVAQAQNEQVAKSMDETIDALKIGKTKAIVNNSMILDSLKPLQFAPITTYSEFTEARDYIINSFYNAIGLQTLEEKKERMISDEIKTDGDVLRNNIDILYKQQVENWNKFNDFFGTDVKVYKNSIIGANYNDEIVEEEEIINDSQ